MRKSLAVLALVVCFVGCQKVNVQKSWDLEPGSTQAVIVDAPSSDQDVVVEYDSSDGPIDVFVVLETDQQAASDAVGMGKAPDKKLAGQQKSDKGKLTAKIPSGKGYAVVVGGAGKKTKVNVKVNSK